MLDFVYVSVCRLTIQQLLLKLFVFVLDLQNDLLQVVVFLLQLLIQCHLVFVSFLHFSVYQSHLQFAALADQSLDLRVFLLIQLHLLDQLRFQLGDKLFLLLLLIVDIVNFSANKLLLVFHFLILLGNLLGKLFRRP